MAKKKTKKKTARHGRPSKQINIRNLDASEINPAAYNPRIELQPGDVAYEKLRRSIETFGYVDPLIWNSESGNLVGGHQRFRVMKELGYTDFDVTVVSLTDDREKALNIALNNPNLQGEYDNKMLAELLKELSELDVDDVVLTGFDTDEIDDIFNLAMEEDIEDGGEAEGGDDSDGDGGGANQGIVIQTQIVFATDSDLQNWYEFTRMLRDRYPEVETTGERVAIHCRYCLNNSESIGA